MRMMQFWKQFFEASANVSLSGYEEPPMEDESATEEEATSITTPSTSTYASPPHTHDDPTVTPQSNGQTYDSQSFSPSPAQSTPRPAQKQAKASREKASTMSNPSPFESTKRGAGPAPEYSLSESTLPSTPRAQDGSLQGFYEPQSSPFAPPSTSAHTAHKTPANDILLHRVLDKNWRLQATPHSVAKLPYRNGPMLSSQTPRPGTARKDKSEAPAEDDLDSSPAIAAPELHAEIFGSPAKRSRIPGVSVLTPAKGRKEGGGRAEVIVKDTSRPAKIKENLWDSDSEEDEDVGAGMSPPKTMQFHVPQGRLVRTPGTQPHEVLSNILLITSQRAKPRNGSSKISYSQQVVMSLMTWTIVPAWSLIAVGFLKRIHFDRNMLSSRYMRFSL